MSQHDRYLDLAAAALDFPLSPQETVELEQHLAACARCRRSVHDMHTDARALTGLPVVPIAPLRAERIHQRALRGSRSSGMPYRFLAVAAVLTLASLTALAVGSGLLDSEETVDPSPQPSASSAATQRPAPSPSVGVVGPTAAPASPPDSTPGSPVPTASASVAPDDPPGVSRNVTLPMTGPILDESGRGFGSRLVAGDDGVLHVALAGARGMTLALFDRRGGGTPLPGWPLRLEGLRVCSDLVPAGDGSTRIACQLPGEDTARSVVHAFSREGTALPGWPVEVEGDLRLWEQRHQPRVVDGTTWLLPGAVLAEGDTYSAEAWLVRIAEDASVEVGRRMSFACCVAVPVLGPDLRGYFSVVTDLDLVTIVTAFDLQGVAPGWPIEVPEWSSGPAFDAEGRVYLAVGGLDATHTRTVVLDRDGRDLGRGSDELAILSSSPWVGAGEEPAPPVVAPDGTAYIVESGNGTRVVGVGPSGESGAGWPYVSSLPVQPLGSCDNGGDTGCGYWLTAQATGPDRTLYLLLATAEDGRGGSILALGPDGRVRDGWPVTLRRAGSEFHVVTVGADGTVWALADESEPGGRSASILALDADSTVIFTTTVVEP